MVKGTFGKKIPKKQIAISRGRKKVFKNKLPRSLKDLLGRFLAFFF
jgi:hypothetical protein